MKVGPLPVSNEAARANLRAAADRRRVALTALSRMIGERDTFLQGFVARGSPKVLPHHGRRLLATFLRLGEHELGASDEDPA